MLSRLRRGVLWVSRAKYCRGFGIQSPWAYRFVRYVINEHWPYYAYDELRRAYPRLSLRQRKLGELYLRIANYQQADEVELFGDFSPATRAYLQAGCHKMKLVAEGETTAETFSLAIVARSRQMERQVLSLMDRTEDGSMLIVENIHKDAAARRSWARMRQDERVRVSFDLYYCGILFFDKKKYKQGYKINF